jgi:hypothetical protein
MLTRTTFATTIVIVAISAAQANAAQIIAFGQSSGSNTVTATTNAGNTATTISITDGAIGITQIFGGVPGAAMMDLTATSINPVTVGASLQQDYSGSFCIASGPGCTGTVDLQGSFTDAVFGFANGTQLSVNVADPPENLPLSSDVIPALQLGPPSSFTLSMSNLTPPLAVAGTTIASFSASFSDVAGGNIPRHVLVVPTFRFILVMSAEQLRTITTIGSSGER